MKKLSSIIAGTIAAASIALSSPARAEAGGLDWRRDSDAGVNLGIGAGTNGGYLHSETNLNLLGIPTPFKAKGEPLYSRIMLNSDTVITSSRDASIRFETAYLTELPALLSIHNTPDSFARMGLEVGPLSGIYFAGDAGHATGMQPYLGLRHGLAIKSRISEFSSVPATGYAFLNLPLVKFPGARLENPVWGGGITSKIEFGLGKKLGLGGEIGLSYFQDGSAKNEDEKHNLHIECGLYGVFKREPYANAFFGGLKLIGDMPESGVAGIAFAGIGLR